MFNCNIWEQTNAESILVTIKKKKWVWGRTAMRKTDNRWLTKVTEWQPRHRASQGRQMTRWRDEIRAFTGAGWSTLA